jgi:hypothetical protein
VCWIRTRPVVQSVSAQLQAEQLALPHARHDGEDVQCLEGVGLRGGEEGPGLHRVERVYLVALRPWGAHGVRRIPRDQPPVQRLTERRVQHGMQELHRPG